MEKFGKFLLKEQKKKHIFISCENFSFFPRKMLYITIYNKILNYLKNLKLKRQNRINTKTNKSLHNKRNGIQ